MKIFLTGAAGFIGSHVARQLLQRGDQVVGVDNFNDYYDPQQKWHNATLLGEFENFELVVDDICNSQHECFERHNFDAVIHLAAMAGVRNSVRSPALYLNVNLTASQQLIETAREFSVSNFVFASTSSVYGRTLRIPFDESDACCNPLHPYAVSKRSVEQIGYAYHQCYGLNFTVLRLFTVYGPSGRPDMMPFLLADSIATGNAVPRFQGNFRRDWTYVSDIADGIVAAVDRPLGFEIINLGRGNPESLERFIEELQSVAQCEANLKPTACPATEMLMTFADNSKAHRLLDFAPQVSIEQGVPMFWEWFKSRQNSADHTVMEQANVA